METRSADDRIGVAVVGLGVGRLHVLALKELRARYRVVAVCDVDLERAGEVAGWLRDVRAVATLDEVLAMDDVEVVDLCTPPAQHAEQIVRCLEAGRDVVCEKPLVGSVRAVDELVAHERATGRTVMPVLQYRFGRGIQRLLALVAAGRTGPAYVAHVEVAWKRGAEYYGASPWRGRWATELGGTLTVHAVHHLDMVLQVLGRPDHVFTRTATLVTEGIEVEDTAAAVLRYDSGTLVTLSATTGSAAELSRLRFAFQHLSAESSTAPYAPGSEPWTWTPADPDDRADLDAFLASVPAGPEDFVGQLARYADARAAGAAPPVTLSDVRTLLEVLTAMYVSSREGTEVALPLPPDHPALDGWQP